jgi:hypothetical protein
MVQVWSPQKISQTDKKIRQTPSQQNKPDVVVYTCNPSYAEDIRRRIIV